MIEKVRKTIPMLPDERRKKYQELKVSEINSKKIVQNRMISDYFNTLLNTNINFQTAANLLLGDIAAYLNKNEKSISETTLSKERFIDLVNNIDNNTLTSKNLKEILDEVLETNSTIEEIINKNHIENITDDNKIREIIIKIISENEESVKDYKQGKERAIKYLMGQVMKETKGSVNPQIANNILEKELNK